MNKNLKRIARCNIADAAECIRTDIYYLEHMFPIEGKRPVKEIEYLETLREKFGNMVVYKTLTKARESSSYWPTLIIYKYEESINSLFRAIIELTDNQNDKDIEEICKEA